MKKIIFLLTLITIFISCSNNDDALIQEQEAVEEVEETSSDTDSSTEATDYAMGDFVDRAHPTSGKATVNFDQSILSFTNFKTDNGPKLLVYLSTDVNSSEFINLGDLKGISGDFTYNIPANTNIEKYKLVNIWCVDFSVSFGTAELKK